MRAFEVYLNGKRLCTAGIGDDGVLTVITDHVIGDRRDEVHFRVGGLISSKDEFVTWKNAKLKTGDEVRISVVESDSIDRPRERRRRDRAEELRQSKRYVRTMAKQFGWQIISRPKKAG